MEDFAGNKKGLPMEVAPNMNNGSAVNKDTDISADCQGQILSYKMNISRYPFKVKPTGTETGHIQIELGKQPGKDASLVEIQQAITKGQTFILADVDGKGTSKGNFIKSCFIGWDIDNTDFIEIENKKTKVPIEKISPKYTAKTAFLDKIKSLGIIPNLVYNTFSNTPDCEKFRVILLLDQYIDSVEEYEKLAGGFIDYFKTDDNFKILDSSCKNCNRLWFGSNNCELLSHEQNKIATLQGILATLPKPIEKLRRNTDYQLKPVYDSKFALSDLEYLEQSAHLFYNNLDYQSWLNLCLEITELGESARSAWLDISRNQIKPRSEAEHDKIFTDTLVNRDGILNFATYKSKAFDLGFRCKKTATGLNQADQQAEPKPERTEIDYFILTVKTDSKTGKKTVKIQADRALLIKFLEKSGFRKLPECNERETNLIKTTDKIYSQATVANITDFLTDHLNSSKFDNYRTMFENAKIEILQGASPKFWLNLKTIIPEKSKDTAQNGYYFFNNGFYDISATDIKQKPYSEFDGYIWQSKTQKRDFKYTENIGEFEQFCMNTQRTNPGELDPQRWESFCTIIGYTLHRFHNPALCKVVIFNDEKIKYNNTDANGRTGKSLVAKCIQEIMRPGFFLDCKTANFKDSFLYEGAKPYHEIALYDDVQPKFPFEVLYNQISSLTPINAKFKGKIAFFEHIKYIVTSNSLIDLISESSRARAVQLFFSDHYNLNFQPDKDFGHLLFIDWTGDLVNEWNHFYSFMLRCLQFYLKHGIIEFFPETYKTRQAIELIAGGEVYQWLEEFIVATGGNESNKLEYEATLKSFNSYTGHNLKSNYKLSQYIKKYCDLMKIKNKIPYKSHGDYFYIIG